MYRIYNYIVCDECSKEFNRSNYPVTLMCGHNYCRTCLKSKNSKFVCNIDKIAQDANDNPSIDYINLIEAVKSISELYQPGVSDVEQPVWAYSGIFYDQPANTQTKKVCKYFLKGKCRFGGKCWNKHN
jgi:hypothetical protein